MLAKKLALHPLIQIWSLLVQKIKNKTKKPLKEQNKMKNKKQAKEKDGFIMGLQKPMSDIIDATSIF